MCEGRTATVSVSINLKFSNKESIQEQNLQEESVEQFLTKLRPILGPIEKEIRTSLQLLTRYLSGICF